MHENAYVDQLFHIANFVIRFKKEILNKKLKVILYYEKKYLITTQ